MLTPDHTRITALLKRPEPVTWVFAGDSITHGALHTYGGRDYTEHFSERLRFEMMRGRDVVIKTGISGWALANFLPDIEWSCLRHRPDVVSINFGLNDCRGGAAGVARFREDYRAVLARLRAADAAIVLHTPNGVLPADEMRTANMPPYLDAIRELASEADCVLVDHWAQWKGCISYWLSDPAHPTDLGHRAMAHTLLRELGMWDDKSEVCRLFVPNVEPK
jgi:lysophospholipase L1-like esterase